MPPNRRRPQQHRGQRAQRQRRYVSGGQGQSYKPGFPVNLFTGRAALTTFVVIGVVAMAGGLILGVFLNDGGEADIDEVPTVTATETAAVEEPTEDADAVVRNFEFAEYVIDEAAETYTATISTEKGDIVIELYAEDAPNTVNNFVFLAEQGYFDGIIFHRVEEGFVVQGGDPTGSGTGGPGYTTNDEPNEIHNEAGTVSMAKVPGQAYFGSQFFINLKDNPGLDFDAGNNDSFYPFGRVIEGMDTVNAIVRGDVMQSVTITRTPRPDAPTPEADADGEDADGDEDMEGEAEGADGEDDGEDDGEGDSGDDGGEDESPADSGDDAEDTDDSAEDADEE